MFQIGNINETFIKQFEELGITNENDIVAILNGLDSIAEIGYAWYSYNNHNILINNEKES